MLLTEFINNHYQYYDVKYLRFERGEGVTGKRVRISNFYYLHKHRYSLETITNMSSYIIIIQENSVHLQDSLQI